MSLASILVIEDNLEVRENICELLELSGYAVHAAENGKVGIQQALEHLPELILCDVMMPILDGHGTLKVLRSNPQTQHIPFVFLTAKAEKEDFRSGMNLGADDYITKPFTDLELLHAVELRLSTARRSTATADAAAFFDPAQHFERALLRLVEQHPKRSYPKRTHFFQANEIPQAVYYLHEGRANSYATNAFGKELHLNLYRAGDLIGLGGVLGQQAHRSSAWAMSDCQATVLPHEALETWLRTDANLPLHLLRLMAQRALDKNNLLLELAYSSTRKRVAEGLLRLYRYFGGGVTTFSITLKREALSHLMGTTKETVTRTLSDFKEEGLVALKGSTLTLLDIEGLEEVPD